MTTKSIGTKIDDATSKAKDLAATTTEQITELADKVGGAGVDAKRKAREVAKGSGNQLEENAEKAGHKFVELATKVTHAAQETVQKVIHGAEEVVDAAKHRREERTAKAARSKQP